MTGPPPTQEQLDRLRALLADERRTETHTLARAYAEIVPGLFEDYERLKRDDDVNTFTTTEHLVALHRLLEAYQAEAPERRDLLLPALAETYSAIIPLLFRDYENLLSRERGLLRQQLAAARGETT